MLITLVALATIIGAPVALIGVYFTVKQGITQSRESRENRQSAAIAAAVKAATDPLRQTIKNLREALAAMTTDRNYFRQHADELEAELREKNK
ncbi:hypothetical protein ACSMXN_09230 [Jatrophihabitans sp. DSM 45814]